MKMKKQSSKERPLVEQTKHAAGQYGGFSFGGVQPDGVQIVNPLEPGTLFPNGAKAAVLLTFDVEGNYGNGTGSVQQEISNYELICSRLRQNGIPATFNIVAKMVEDHGVKFVEQMLASGSEIAPHGYVHDLNKYYGGDKVYAGHYGVPENQMQINQGLQVFCERFPDEVSGYRLPYGHFNEFSYNAIESGNLKWASHVGIDDFINPSNGYGTQPFQIRMGNKLYNLVEIPLDTQTFDWPIWIACPKANKLFVDAVGAYCESRNIAFVRTPAGGALIWKRRILEAVSNDRVFTLLCHPINLTLENESWGNPVEQFLFPTIDLLGELQRSKKLWVCTCQQMADFYRSINNL
ncbi:MAG: hypothetical protein DHS20C17_00690 [Cyclobacteriaceae bacterium]|nr:MAG: hypothetical protein DHS20C17_00690 [Cyclobacteriaceae bacterium]